MLWSFERKFKIAWRHQKVKKTIKSLDMLHCGIVFNETAIINPIVIYGFHSDFAFSIGGSSMPVNRLYYFNDLSSWVSRKGLLIVTAYKNAFEKAGAICRVEEL